MNKKIIIIIIVVLLINQFCFDCFAFSSYSKGVDLSFIRKDRISLTTVNIPKNDFTKIKIIKKMERFKITPIKYNNIGGSNIGNSKAINKINDFKIYEKKENN